MEAGPIATQPTPSEAAQRFYLCLADRDERDAHGSNDPTESPDRELPFEDL